MKINEIANEIDSYIASNPPHRFSDARMLQICISDNNEEITNALRCGDGDMLIAACNSAINSGVRTRMVRCRMENRDKKFSEFLREFTIKMNAEIAGVEVIWQTPPEGNINAAD